MKVIRCFEYDEIKPFPYSNVIYLNGKKQFYRNILSLKILMRGELSSDIDMNKMARNYHGKFRK